MKKSIDFMDFLYNFLFLSPDCSEDTIDGRERKATFISKCLLSVRKLTVVQMQFKLT